MAKLIATVCVVFVHSINIFNFEGIVFPAFLEGFKAIAEAGVPVFFLISGYYLMLKRDFSWKKKMKTLAVPFVSWMLLYAAFNVGFYEIVPSMFDNYRTFTIGDWLQHLVGIPFVTSPDYYGPFWFLRDLIILNVFTFILVPITKVIPNEILILLMFLLEGLPLPSHCRYAIVFFVIGMVLGRRKSVPVLGARMTAEVFALCFLTAIFLDSNLVERLAVIPMALIIISVGELMVERPKVRTAVEVLMPFSFITYLTHQHPLTLMQKLIAMKCVLNTETITILYFVLPFVAISLCCVFSVCCRRWMPRIYNTLTGSR